MPSLVVSFEGPDFTGKTTISNLVVENLRRVFGNEVLIKKTELPSTLITGFFPKALRGQKDKPSSRVLALAYAVDHLYHYENIIKPLKNRKERYVVIQERSLLSTLIYQAIIGDLDIDWVRTINMYDKNIPELTIVLKVDYKELLRRKRIENREYDMYEEDEFLKKETEVYYNLPGDLVKEFNVVYVDANGLVDSVVEKCTDLISNFVKEKFNI